MNFVTRNTANTVTQLAPVTAVEQVSPVYKPYRVLMVTGIYPSEKRPHSGTFIKSQADSLLPLGIEIEVIHPKPGPWPVRYISTAMQVFTKTISGQYDIVHGHYGLWCLLARMQWKTPVVASFLGSDLLGVVTEKGSFSSIGKFVSAVSRWLCRHVDAVIVKSEEMKQVSRFQDGIVLPNGVDFALFHPIPRAEARIALGWHSSRYHILFGNDPEISRKNFALAQAAVAILQAKKLDVKLIVANSLPQTQVALYINACNALVLPSIAEGSPNIVKETMACNVPVVATDVGDVRQVIGQTDGCAVCPPDPAAFAIALEKAILRTQPTTGREDIRHLDRIVVAQQVIAVYERAIQYHKRHTRRARKRLS
jgi:teichuronic acid biosynthesis glycosyltransferase TuaC